jgi:hypothetical protein
MLGSCREKAAGVGENSAGGGRQALPDRQRPNLVGACCNEARFLLVCETEDSVTVLVRRKRYGQAMESS